MNANYFFEAEAGPSKSVNTCFENSHDVQTAVEALLLMRGLRSKEQWPRTVLQNSAGLTPFHLEVEMEDISSKIPTQESDLARVRGSKNSKLESDFQALSLETGHPLEPPSYKLQNTLEGLKCESIWSVKFSPSGKSIASAGNGIINVWDAAGKLECELVCNIDGMVVSEVDWSKEGSFLLSTGLWLQLWNVNTGEFVKRLRGHELYCVSSAKFSPDNSFIISGSDDCTAKIWDAKIGVCLKTINEETPVEAVDFHPDGTRFMVTSCNGECYMYDLRSYDIVEDFTAKDPISAAKFSSDSRYILFSMQDYSLRLYDMRKQKVAGIYKRPKNVVSASNFSFTTSGKYIVSGAHDNLIYIWDVNTQEMVEVLEGHSGTVNSVDCHPENDIIVSGSCDNSIKIWKSS